MENDLKMKAFLLTIMFFGATAKNGFLKDYISDSLLFTHNILYTTLELHHQVDVMYLATVLLILAV